MEKKIINNKPKLITLDEFVSKLDNVYKDTVAMLKASPSKSDSENFDTFRSSLIYKEKKGSTPQDNDDDLECQLDQAEKDHWGDLETESVKDNKSGGHGETSIFDDLHFEKKLELLEKIKSAVEDKDITDLMFHSEIIVQACPELFSNEDELLRLGTLLGQNVDDLK